MSISKNRYKIPPPLTYPQAVTDGGGAPDLDRARPIGYFLSIHQD
jgi:hypothetical protein